MVVLACCDLRGARGGLCRHADNCAQHSYLPLINGLERFGSNGRMATAPTRVQSVIRADQARTLSIRDAYRNLAAVMT